jgi:hypothetical protein
MAGVRNGVGGWLGIAAIAFNKTSRLLPRMLPQAPFGFDRCSGISAQVFEITWLPGPDSNQRPTG